MNFLLCDKCGKPMKDYPTKAKDPAGDQTVDAIWWECGYCGRSGYGWDLGEDQVEVYFDDTHLWSPCEPALHWLAKKIGLKRSHYQAQARHPHYDVWGQPAGRLFDRNDIMWVSKREMLCYMQLWETDDYLSTLDGRGELDSETRRKIERRAGVNFSALTGWVSEEASA